MNLEIEEMCARLENSTRDVLAIVARNQITTVLEALPESALEARLALSMLAIRLGVDMAELKGRPDGAPTVTRFHAKEES